MQLKLKWKKKIFSNVYKIYGDNQQSGELSKRSFSKTSTAALNDKRYTYRTTGFFEQFTEIKDKSENKIGEIKYGSWMTRATINLGEKTYHWKYCNMWNSEWSLYDENEIKITYRGSSSTGNIHSNTDDPLLLLTGLYISNYYWETTFVVLLIIFIPIFLS
jgi:hypothetical protein